MVIFENEEERDYFNNRMMIGEIARLTMIRILNKVETDSNVTKDEITKFQSDSVNELKEEVRKLNEEEKDGSFNEQAEALVNKAEEINKSEAPSYT